MNLRDLAAREETMEKYPIHPTMVFSHQYIVTTVRSIMEQEKDKPKYTWPSSSSAITQPTDHMSIAVVYSVAPKISSGAL